MMSSIRKLYKSCHDTRAASTMFVDDEQEELAPVRVLSDVHRNVGSTGLVNGSPELHRGQLSSLRDEDSLLGQTKESTSRVTERALPLKTLEGLPDDLLLPILGALGLGELDALSLVSKALNDKVNRLGYTRYLHNHRTSYTTLSPSPPTWEPKSLIKLNERVNRNVGSHTFRSSLLGRTWSRKAMGGMDLTDSQLLVVVDQDLHIHDLVSPKEGRGGKLAKEARVVRCISRAVDEQGHPFEVTPAKDAVGSITRVKALRNGQVILSFADGTLGRFDISSGAEAVQTKAFVHTSNWIHSLEADGRDHFVATSVHGRVSLYDANGSQQPTYSFDLPRSVGRAWCSLLATHSIPGIDPFLALGVTSRQGLQIHSLGATGEPTAVPSRKLEGGKSTSSPYDLHLPPTTSSHNPSMLLSSWYDTHLRLHDLRSSSQTAVIDLHDPFSDDALYSCAWLGEHYAASGGSRHRKVAIFDLRYPKLGWTTFAPSAGDSPVYSLIGDGGRLWGVTETQSWVMEFDGFRAVHESARPETTDEAEQGRGDGRWVRGVGRQSRPATRTPNLPRSWVVGFEHSDSSLKLFRSVY